MQAIFRDSTRCAIDVLRLALLGVVLSQSLYPTVLCAAEQDSGQNPDVTWIVLRHAERDGDHDALSKAGQTRAEQLRQLGEVLNVTAVYTTNYERTKKTVEPLCKALGLTPETYRQTSKEWFQDVRRRHAGGVVLIVGHSNTAGAIAGSLGGVAPFPIEHDEYDNLFIVQQQQAAPCTIHLRYGARNAELATPAN
ncbi:MAG: phosphoglycerate mutase family protein [Pirellulaceae bacterium]